MALERDKIVATALRLLDEGGLEKLTLRRLAAELGVQAPALYWHFKNKQELLDEMTEVITVHEGPRIGPPAEGETWDAWLAEWVREQRRVLNSHRDSVRLTAGTHPGQGMLSTVDMILGSLTQVGFAVEDAMWGVTALSSFLGGFVLEEQADRERGSGEWSQFHEALEILAPYPHLREAMIRIGGPQSQDAFDHGVALILEGMRARLAASSDRQEGHGDLEVEGDRPAAG
ncbi:TetR/AcrR family transcriptional regulator C-terminal domain-containing protein [Planotetraspora phitsanulokensis]|uniref:TetR family transcriptional regulator n=1 Tax=Planotetraspora phitsanulokensis TaxID=575192 RepID=A0A8J3U8J4_9ACTN|nr:TetR/AcrR family transcriptional regulator C-terminal domain-containing protein [Planotetraspora phitsanulokensis]GII39042.1 TetR family transcriptional regulator [Planotetraspora phitsanulokensis]